MAENEIIILDDFDDEDLDFEEGEYTQSINPASKNNNKKLYIAIAILSFMTLLVIIFLAYTYYTKQQNKEVEQEPKAQEIITKIKARKEEKTEIKDRLNLTKKEKADQLFNQGKEKEALKIYQSISSYNNALSFYNIGVAHFKEKKYDEAIESFLHSMGHEKLLFESAINIAVAYFNKNDKENFQKYLDLSIEYLSTTVKAPLYSYYRALTDYYSRQFPETIVPLKYQTSDYYPIKQRYLISKIYTALKNESLAIKALELNNNPKDSFTLGLLNARLGEYKYAQKYLLESLEERSNTLKSKISLSLVENKMGQLKSAAERLRSAKTESPDRAEDLYPIKVILKESFFDPIEAQKDFKKQLFFTKRYKYALIFYYAPYNAIATKQTLNKINQGVKNIYINKNSYAIHKLDLSKNISDANLENSRGIEKVLSHKMYEAKDIFEKGITKYPSSAELHYNLALTYANLFNFQKAYEHFRKSYTLNNSNYLAKVFSYYCGELTNKKQESKEMNILEKEVSYLSNSRYKERILSLIAISRKSFGINLNLAITKEPFDEILMLIFARHKEESTAYKQSSANLLEMLPNDIIANILYIDAMNDKENIKEYALEIQKKLTRKNIDYQPLIYGGSLAKELYINTLNIAGIVNYAKNTLKRKESKQKKKSIALMQSIAYANIFLRKFQESFDIYNKLIDEYNQKDTNTLFLASVAAIGAKHHAQAIALLELAKLSDTSNLESRYALGLLYQEAKNFDGASIQYNKIGDIKFKSRYFDFHL